MLARKGKQNYNYYGVSNGRTVGIFKEWIPTSESVLSYSNASFQGFVTLEDAVEYLHKAGLKDIQVHTCSSSLPIAEYQARNVKQATQSEQKISGELHPSTAHSQLPTPSMSVAVSLPLKLT